MNRIVHHPVPLVLKALLIQGFLNLLPAYNLLDRLKEDDGEGQGNEIEEGEEELFESQKSVQVDTR